MSDAEKKPDAPPAEGDVQATQTVQTEAADAVKPAKEKEDWRFSRDTHDMDWEQRNAGPQLRAWGFALETLARETLRDHGLLLVERSEGGSTFMQGLGMASLWDEMMQRPLKTRMLAVRDRPVMREDAVALVGESRAALAHIVVDESARLAADIASRGPHRCEVRAYIRKPKKGKGQYRGVLSIFKLALPDRKEWAKNAPPSMWDLYDGDASEDDEE